MDESNGLGFSAPGDVIGVLSWQVGVMVVLDSVASGGRCGGFCLCSLLNVFRLLRQELLVDDVEVSVIFGALCKYGGPALGGEVFVLEEVVYVFRDVVVAHGIGVAVEAFFHMLDGV